MTLAEGTATQLQLPQAGQGKVDQFVVRVEEGWLNKRDGTPHSHGDVT